MVERPNTRTVKADGEAVKRFRMDKGWRVEDLAKQAGCSVKTVENVERGANVYPFTLKKFAEALKVDYRMLLPNAPEQKAPRFVEVQIKFAFPYEDFDESEQLVGLIGSLHALLKGNQIGVLKVEGGSTIITLEMEEGDVQKLVELFEAGTLYELSIVAINTGPVGSGIWLQNMDLKALFRPELVEEVEKSKQPNKKSKQQQRKHPKT